MNEQSISGQYFITGEQVNVSKDIPGSELTDSSQGEHHGTINQYISDVYLNESMNTSFTYNQIQIIPPGNLPTSSSFNER